MSLPLLRFLQIPEDIDFDNVFLSDPSATESSSSPHLTASDDMLLDPTYWTDHPPRYRYLMQCILPLLPALETAGFHVRTHHWDWATDLFVNDTQATTTTTPLAADSGSTTEPESDVEVTPSAAIPAAQSTTTPLAADPGSTTEPESDIELNPKPSAATTTPIDTGSTTELESDVDITPSAAASASATTIVPPRLNRCSFFATPSPPPPDSIYWKYVTREEDSRWYDRCRDSTTRSLTMKIFQ